MKVSNLINIFLVMFIIYLLLKPKPVENPYYIREIKASIKRQDSLVNEINNLKTLKDEIKDSMVFFFLPPLMGLRMNKSFFLAISPNS